MISIKLTAICIAFAVLTGCASGPQKSVLSAQEKEDLTLRLAKIKKVDVLYSNDNGIVVIDSGGSGATGLSGLLGPIGMLAAVAIDAASKVNAIDRSKNRSQELSQKVRADLPNANLSKDFAEAVAAKLTSRGMDVHVTALTSDRTGTDLAAYPDLSKVQDGRAAIIIWNNPGLAAESATSAFQTSAVIDYYCRDSDKVKIVDGQILRRGPEVGRSFSGLLADVKTPYEILKSHYISQHEQLVSECFDVPENKRETDRLKTVYQKK